MNAHKAGICM
jgi:hypothetical protein